MGRGNNLDTSLCGDGFSNKKSLSVLLSCKGKTHEELPLKMLKQSACYGNAGSIAHIAMTGKLSGLTYA